MTDIETQPAPATDDLRSMWKTAEALSRADVIPKHFRGKPANLFVAIDIARRLGASVFEVAQNLCIIHGSPSWRASYSIAMANARGPFKGPIKFAYDESDPENPKACAYATVRETEESVEFVVDMAMARAEGWTRNSKYSTLPRLMLSYRAATLLVRLYCPEVLLGLHTSDELEDVAAADPRAVDIEPQEGGALGEMQALMGAEENTEAGAPTCEDGGGDVPETGEAFDEPASTPEPEWGEYPKEEE